jgi:hypothetical protein
MEEHRLPKFDYHLDESDPDVVILRRADGTFVAPFSASGATREGILEAAKDDYGQLAPRSLCSPAAGPDYRGTAEHPPERLSLERALFTQVPRRREILRSPYPEVSRILHSTGPMS